VKIEDITNNIQEKLGQDEASKIVDDIASILTYDNTIQQDLKKKDEEITKLKKDKDILIQANSNLLQQIPLGKEETKEEPKEREPFDFKTVFDGNGFKR